MQPRSTTTTTAAIPAVFGKENDNNNDRSSSTNCTTDYTFNGFHASGGTRGESPSLPSLGGSPLSAAAPAAAAWKIFMDDDDQEKPDWRMLNEIEIRRRLLLEKVELPCWRILASWDGTCIRALVKNWLIWIPILIFVIIRIQDYRGVEQPNFVDFDDSSVNILGGFVSFLLVLFLNGTDTRFQSMYRLSKGCVGSIQDAAGLASSLCSQSDNNEETTTTTGSVELCHRLMRYMNAAHIAGYVGLNGPYSKRHFFDHYNQEYNLLTKKELEKLEIHDMDSSNVVFKILISWCHQVIDKSQKLHYINDSKSDALHEKVLQLRSSMDGIYNYTEQPVQFFYIHFLVLISALYLPLFAITIGYSNGGGDNFANNWEIDVLNFTFVMFQSIFVVGLRILAQKMSDPYGLDLVDLSVMTYVYSGIDTSNVIMSANLVD